MTRPSRSSRSLVLMLGLVCSCAKATGREPPSPSTIVSSVTGDARSGRTIHIKNNSAVPILIYSLAVRNCENVSFGCDSTNPNVRIDPGQRGLIGKVQAKTTRELPRFRYFYLWRAAPTSSFPAPTTMVGREVAALLQRSHGTIVISQPLGRLKIVTFPSRTSGLAERDAWFPESLDGPDSAGTIALVTDSTGWTEHQLRIRYADGREETLARRPGGILWHHAIGPIALAPVGGRIAFARKTGDTLNNYQPLGIGALEMWDPATRSIRLLDAPGIEQKPAWFPDGRRLLFVHPPIEGTPRLVLLDVVSGEREQIAVGDVPVVSSDGRTILTRQQTGLTLLDVATRTGKPITLPGNLAAPLALIDSRYVVYRALPTEGLPTGVTSNNSPLVGPKAMQSIKLIDLENGQFVTLVDFIDPRDHISVSLRIR